MGNINCLNELWINHHGFCVWTHMSSICYKECEPNILCDEWWDTKGLCKSVKHTKRPNALAYDEKNIHVKRWVVKKS